jgi:hypothetical protein
MPALPTPPSGGGISVQPGGPSSGQWSGHSGSHYPIPTRVAGCDRRRRDRKDHPPGNLPVVRRTLVGAVVLSVLLPSCIDDFEQAA